MGCLRERDPTRFHGAQFEAHVILGASVASTVMETPEAQGTVCNGSQAKDVVVFLDDERILAHLSRTRVCSTCAENGHLQLDRHTQE